MHIVGLIPARGGSRAIPRKNLAPLAGRPLLAYTCEAARASRRLTRLVLSTDDAEIARIGADLGAEVFARSADLAGDDTPMLDVVRSVAGDFLVRTGEECDVIVVLQPTSPLRRAVDIDASVDLLLSTGADAVVSVTEVPHGFTPTSLMREVDGRLVPLSGDGPLLRQKKPLLFARNGPAVLAVRTSAALRQGLYEGHVRGYAMDRRYSVDVDDAVDLRLAEFWLHENTRATEVDAS